MEQVTVFEGVACLVCTSERDRRSFDQKPGQRFPPAWCRTGVREVNTRVQKGAASAASLDEH